tara:strand:+ start:428 stop:730 length:303 start_codon:yes stop_codon:yes gene_type:complete
MKNSIREELQSYVQELKEDNVLTPENKEDWHYYAFNESHYIIGYYNAEEWLKKHNLSPFQAVQEVREYEMDNFGEMNTELNSEAIVNMLVYIYGEEIIHN